MKGQKAVGSRLVACVLSALMAWSTVPVPALAEMVEEVSEERGQAVVSDEGVSIGAADPDSQDATALGSMDAGVTGTIGVDGAGTTGAGGAETIGKVVDAAPGEDSLEVVEAAPAEAPLLAAQDASDAVTTWADLATAVASASGETEKTINVADSTLTHAEGDAEIVVPANSKVTLDIAAHGVIDRNAGTTGKRAITVESGAVLTIKGGTVRGGKESKGGGIYVKTGATLALGDAKPQMRSKDGVDYIVYPFEVKTSTRVASHKLTMKIKDEVGDRYLDFANSDALTVEGDEGLPYSVYDYLTYMAENGETEKMKTLAKATYAYCEYARYYFAVLDGESPESPKVKDFVPVTLNDLAGIEVLTPLNLANFVYKGTTLVLDDVTSFRLYFTSKEPGSLKIAIDDSPAQVHESVSKGMYYVEITDISSTKLHEMHSFIISNGVKSTTAHNGPFGYARWAIEQNSESDISHVMQALYRYNEAAKAFFTPSEGE